MINCGAVADLLSGGLNGVRTRTEKRFMDFNATASHEMSAQNTIVNMGLMQQLYARVRVSPRGTLI